MDLGVVRADRLPAERLAAISRGALDRPLRGDAELLVAVPEDEAVVLGAFERGTVDARARRGSGGASVRVGPGSVWAALALARPDALVACDADRLLNRHVRPLLKALTRSGALAHYFGRDWVSVAKRPVALVAFAHDAGTGRCLVEAIVGVTTPFAVREDRPSFLGKAPSTVAAHAPRVTPAALADAIVSAYLEAFDRTEAPREAPEGADPGDADETPWAATNDEAIGLIGAGRDRTGRMRVGGELMASRDAVRDLEDRLARGEDPAIAVEAALAAPGVTVFGVKDVASIADVLTAAG